MTDELKNFILDERKMLVEFVSQLEGSFDQIRKESMNTPQDNHDAVILLIQKAARVEGQLIAYNKVILLLDNIIKTDEGKAHEIKVIPFVRRNKDD